LRKERESQVLKERKTSAWDKRTNIYKPETILRTIGITSSELAEPIEQGQKSSSDPSSSPPMPETVVTPTMTDGE